MSKAISPNSTLAHYTIISQIGAGGMGKVYLAKDTKLDRKVAIKFLHDELSKDSDKLNRFVKEAKAESAQRYFPGYHLAIANLTVGDRDAAFALLEKDIAERGPLCPGFAFDPLLDELRSDPRFAALVQKVELSKID